MNDLVNYPAHYTDGKIEVWDFILDKKLTYCLGNVVKYVSRAGKKDKATHLQDLRKAEAYLQREIKRVEEEAAISADPLLVVFTVTRKAKKGREAVVICSHDQNSLLQSKIEDHMLQFHPDTIRYNLDSR